MANNPAPDPTWLYVGQLNNALAHWRSTRPDIAHIDRIHAPNNPHLPAMIMMDHIPIQHDPINFTNHG